MSDASLAAAAVKIVSCQPTIVQQHNKAANG
jgi:hypothetical protein